MASSTVVFALCCLSQGVLRRARGEQSHGGLLARRRTFSEESFSEDGYTVTADSQFMSRCVPKWQAECRKSYQHNLELQQKLCETNLDRNYILIRTMIPESDILSRWARYKPWVDFDRGWFSANLPRFTETGFLKAKLPDHLHQAMQDWYRANRRNSLPEGSQPAFGSNCNTGYDNDDWHIAPPDHLLDPISEHVRQLLTDWTGQNVNERVSAYGIREYHRGSICGLHLDNTETHAFSAIYQVDQLGMDEPWASDYVTHSGERGKAYLQPGELLLYESASSLHGRSEALMGDEFANMFIHFRSPEWLPAVEKVKNGLYWPSRAKYESKRHHLVTQSKPSTKTMTTSDECFGIRDRKVALLEQGRFTEPPLVEAYSLAEGDRGHEI